MYNKKTIVLYNLCFGIWSACTILCVYSLVLLYQVRKHYNIIMYHNIFVNYWTRTRVSVLGKCTVPENCTTVPYCTRKLYHLYRTVPYPEPYHSKETYGHMVFLVPIHSMYWYQKKHMSIYLLRVVRFSGTVRYGTVVQFSGTVRYSGTVFWYGTVHMYGFRVHMFDTLWCYCTI